MKEPKQKPKEHMNNEHCSCVQQTGLIWKSLKLKQSKRKPVIQPLKADPRRPCSVSFKEQLNHTELSSFSFDQSLMISQRGTAERTAQKSHLKAGTAPKRVCGHPFKQVTQDVTAFGFINAVGLSSAEHLWVPDGKHRCSSDGKLMGSCLWAVRLHPVWGWEEVYRL